MNSTQIALKKQDAKQSASSHIMTACCANALTLASCVMTVSFFSSLFRPNLFAGCLVGGVVVVLIAVSADLHANHSQNRDAVIARLTYQSDRSPNAGYKRWQRSGYALLLLGLIMVSISTYTNTAFMGNQSANAQVDYAKIDVDLSRNAGSIQGHQEALSEPLVAVSSRADDFQRRVSLAASEADWKALQLEAGAKVDGVVKSETQAMIKQHLEVLRLADERSADDATARRTELTQSLSALESKRTELLLKRAGLEQVGYGTGALWIFGVISLMIDVGAWLLHASLARYDHAHKLAKLSRKVKAIDSAVHDPLTFAKAS